MTTQPAQIAVHRLDLPRESWSLRDVSVLEINLTHLDHNMQVLRRMVGGACGICPIVKADAYGLGAARIGKRLAFAGAKMLAVYTPEQAGELMNTAVGCRILVLMPVREIARVDDIYRGLIADKVHLTVHDLDHVADLIAMTERYGLTVHLHLEIDTGMSRGGCAVADAPEVLEKIAACRRLNLAGIFTHFANAESDIEFTQRQMAMFERLLIEQASRIPKGCIVHAANTFAAVRHARYHRSMVRIGLGWAGYAVECMKAGEVLPEALELKPVLRWKSRIVQVKVIEPGTPVGYGSHWQAQRRTILGLVPVGYADGYPAALGSRSSVAGGEGGGKHHGGVVAVFDRAEPGTTAEHGPLLGYAPVVGAVNMDQVSIDLTDVIARRGERPLNELLARAASGGAAGAVVELISPNPDAPNHLPTLAVRAGMIPHALLTGLSQRVARHYVAPVNPVEHVPHVQHVSRTARSMV